jgi:N-methylhydantoinase A
MRYVGQGHEIPVPLPARPITQDDVAAIRADYDREYSRYYDRPVPGSDVEIMSYAVLVATVPEDVADAPVAPGDARAKPARMQKVRDTVTGEIAEWAVYDRAALGPGAKLRGPAIVAEDETSTLVGPGWSASINALGYIELHRKN